MELLEPNVAAKLLQVTRHTLRRWHMAGKIKAHVTLGGKRRYFTAEILKLMGKVK
jgi:excisionase family DNA binding protein